MPKNPKTKAERLLELPLHAVADTPGVDVERQPGRPRAVARRPSYSQRERAQSLKQGLDEHVLRDPIVQRASTPRSETVATLREIQVEIAREAAGILYDRRNMTPGVRESIQASYRRIRALVEVAHLELAIHRAGGAPELGGELAVRIIEMLITRIGEISREILPGEKAERLMAEWRARIADDPRVPSR